MKKIPKWIVLNYDMQPPLMVCEQCKKSRAVSLPCAVDDMVLQAQAFAESHKFCLRRKPND